MRSTMRGSPSGGEESPIKLIPMRIVLTYLAVGVAWIVLSDSIAFTLFPDPRALSMVQTYKGWVYVAATALMLYLLLKRDMRALERSEAIRRQGEQVFWRRYEAVAAGIVVESTDGALLYANKAASEILHTPIGDLVGTTCVLAGWQAVGEDGSALSCDELPSVIASQTGQPVTGSMIGIITPGLGERHWLLVSAEPIPDRDGAVIETVVTFVDVTERKIIEQELARSREAEMRIHSEAEAAKRDFYKGTIFSVTNGKLNLVSQDEIRGKLAPGAVGVPLRDRADLSHLRDLVDEACEHAGIPEDRAFLLVSAVGEAAANAIKHAHGGNAAVAIGHERVQVLIQDTGHGMDALVLPRATLMRRFSTVTSMGLGYSLILESVDSVYLATGPTGTSVLLEMCVESPVMEMSLEALPDTW